MWERVLDLSELYRSEPPTPLLPLICAARRGPTTMNWLAPPIRAWDQAGRQRPSLWPLDARWGQSNKTAYCPESRPVCSPIPHPVFSRICWPSPRPMPPLRRLSTHAGAEPITPVSHTAAPRRGDRPSGPRCPCPQLHLQID
jgi:hypothetical protein